MGQVTGIVSKVTIQEMKDYYKPHLRTTPVYAVFQAKVSNTVITAYKSGKVLFQGAELENELSKWEDKINVSHSKQRPSTTEQIPTFLNSNHIGSDESGTGDYFGPITTCAIYVQADQIEHLKKMGIQDSKAIQDATIKELSREIVALKIPYSLMVLHNEKYNNLQESGWSQGKMKTMLHDACIHSVLNKINGAPYDGILIDQFCTPQVYQNHLKSEGKQMPPTTHFLTKAEHYSIAVATASIIARASFLKEMEQLSDIAELSLLKGASSKVDQQIAQLMQSKERHFLKKVGKIHFANTKKAMDL